MKQILIRIDKEVDVKISKFGGNKSEFIRQAIDEKLNKTKSDTNKKTVNNLDIEKQIYDIELKLFLLDKKINNTNEIILLLLKEIYKINSMLYDTMDSEQKDKFSSEEFKEYIDSKIDEIGNNFINNFKEEINDE